MTSPKLLSQIPFYILMTLALFLRKNVIEIEKQLNRDFRNRLSIHFGEDKARYIFFTSKRKIKAQN